MKSLALILALFSGSAFATSSTLPIVFRCEEPAFFECHESYTNTEPATTIPCGLGLAERGLECPRGPGFLGACRSAVQGGGGYYAQSVIFYYAGHQAGTAADVKHICDLSNGEYLP